MKVEVPSSKVRFKDIKIGKCFSTNDGCVYMRVKHRDGTTSHAVHLYTGEETVFVNTDVMVIPLKLKAVEDTE